MRAPRARPRAKPPLSPWRPAARTQTPLSCCWPLASSEAPAGRRRRVCRGGAAARAAAPLASAAPCSTLDTFLSTQVLDTPSSTHRPRHPTSARGAPTHAARRLFAPPRPRLRARACHVNATRQAAAPHTQRTRLRPRLHPSQPTQLPARAGGAPSPPNHQRMRGLFLSQDSYCTSPTTPSQRAMFSRLCPAFIPAFACSAWPCLCTHVYVPIHTPRALSPFASATGIIFVCWSPPPASVSPPPNRWRRPSGHLTPPHPASSGGPAAGRGPAALLPWHLCMSHTPLEASRCVFATNLLLCRLLAVARRPGLARPPRRPLGSPFFFFWNPTPMSLPQQTNAALTTPLVPTCTAEHPTCM